MIEAILAAVPVYGLWIVTLTTYLSCLAVPIPASLVMLSAGAFAAAGDLSGPWAAVLAWAGAVLGDQTGFRIGRRGGSLASRFAPDGRAATLMTRAETLADRYGGPGVFLSRWLLSPLGPYMNLVAGAARMDWLSFTLWGAAGEACWVAIYIGLGLVFADRIEAVAVLASDFTGLLAAGAVALALGLWLRAALRADARQRGR